MRPQWHTTRGKPNYSPEGFAEFSGLPPQHKLLALNLRGCSRGVQPLKEPESITKLVVLQPSYAKLELLYQYR
jgi:hypothetical protein